MQVLEVKPITQEIKMLIDRGELELIYQNDIDIKKEIKNILIQTNN